jgi:hypothetical protein
LIPVEMHPRSQSDIDTREANREAMEQRRFEQEREQKRREGTERELEYLKSGGQIERQKSLDRALRALHQIETGRWTPRNTADALDQWEVELLKQAEGIIKPAVAAWAAERRRELKAAVSAAEDERKAKIAQLQKELAGR